MEEDIIEINISIDKLENKVYISEENTSGCEYEINKKSDIEEAFSNYIKYYVDL